MINGTIQSGRIEAFRFNASVAVGIGAVRTEIVGTTVPCKCRARVKSFGNYLGTVPAWGFCYWEVLVNGVPMEFYGGDPRIYDQVGYAAQRQESTEYEISGGSFVQVVGSNPTADIVDMGVSLGMELIYQEGVPCRKSASIPLISWGCTITSTIITAGSLTNIPGMELIAFRRDRAGWRFRLLRLGKGSLIRTT